MPVSIDDDKIFVKCPKGTKIAFLFKAQAWFPVELFDSLDGFDSTATLTKACVYEGAIGMRSSHIQCEGVQRLAKPEE